MVASIMGLNSRIYSKVFMSLAADFDLLDWAADSLRRFNCFLVLQQDIEKFLPWKGLVTVFKSQKNRLY